jgi:signal transduction histidine kinase
MSLGPAVRSRRFSLRRSDVVVAGAITVIVVTSLVYRAVNNDQLLLLLLIAAAVAPLWLRDRQPAAALLLAIAVRATLPENQALLLPALAVLYTIASRHSWRIPAAGASAVTLASLAAGAGWGHITDRGGLLGYTIATTASCAAAVALGLYVGARGRVIDGLRERAERLDRERELLADRAVAEERVRIAQELHDVVAHHVSLMVVQAQGLGATVDDERVSKSTDAIANLGRQAMVEMHRTLRLLRAGETEAATLAPQPGLANLDGLLQQSRAAGLEIELTIEGQPRPLPQSVDLSAFRIVQEALTNVIRHAAGAHTNVMLSYEDDGLRLRILDGGDASDGGPRGEPADGHGVIGMRERASLFGGTLTAQRRNDGFEVTATLPYSRAQS